MNKKSLKVFLVLLVVLGITSLAFTEAVGKKRVINEIEKARTEFKQLILKNPNYFGTITKKAIVEKYKPIYPMQKNIKYEEIKCVGLYPEDNLLEAVIEVKLPYGYKGPLCDAGSTEYVSFYIDYNDGTGFVSVGPAAEVNAHDLSFVNGGHLFYSVQKPFILKKLLKCNTPQVVKVRAILSWEAVPTGPSYIPVWGNVFDVWVQIKPKQIGPIVVMPGYVVKPLEKLELIKPLPEEAVVPVGPIPPEKFMIYGTKKEIKEFIDRSLAAEKRITKEGIVEKERFEFKKLITKNPNYFGSITTSKDKSEIMQAVYQLPPNTIEAILPKLAIDPGWLIPVLTSLKRIKFEELKCVGLYPKDDLLEAVIEVKLPYGFSGDLCTLGSKEYVASYIDWGDGAGYQYVATSTVRVHDIPEVNGKHLFYAVKAKIPNIGSKLKACTTENIVKVKAILSWNVDPTPYGHTYSPTWGNVLTKNIQIRPKDGASAKCEIQIVSEVLADHISQSGSDEGLAIKPGSIFTFDRPFGAVIACWGNINIVDAHYYRFLYSDDGGTTWTAIKDNRRAVNPFWPWGPSYVERAPDSDGWFSKSVYDSDKSNYMLAALLHWRSHGGNGKYQLKLQVAKSDKTVLSEDGVTLVLDNVAPELLEFGGTPAPLPAKGVVVKDSSGNYRKCTTFVGPESIEIWGNFRDDYFSGFSLLVFGGNIDVSGLTIGSGSYDSGLAGIGPKGIIGAVDGGPGAKIDSLNLCTIPQIPARVKCAYGIRLHVSDRAIVGYLNGYEFWKTSHGRNAFVTFEWEPTGCP